MQKKKTKWAAIAMILAALIVLASCGSSTNENVKNEQSDTLSEKDGDLVEGKTLSFLTGQIYEGNDCTISLVEGDEENLNFEIENRSSKDLSFYIHSLSINGIMVNYTDCIQSADTPSQKKGRMQVKFESEWMKDIDNIEYIDVVFWAYDNSESFKDFDTGIIRLTTNNYTEEKEFEASGDYQEENGLTIVCNSMDTNAISYSIINKNDYTIETNLENCSLNEWAFEPGYSLHVFSDSVMSSIDGFGIIVFPNSMANVVVDISEFVNDYNIDEVKSFEFSLDVIPNDDYYNDEHTEKIIFKNQVAKVFQGNE